MKFKRRNSIDLVDPICGNIGYDQPRPRFRGLAEQVVIEVLLGLQQRCAENVKTHRAVLRPLCDELRRTQVGSVADLPEHRCGGNVGDLTPVVGRALSAWPVITGNRTGTR